MWRWQNIWAWKLHYLDSISLSCSVLRSRYRCQMLFPHCDAAYLLQIGVSHSWHHSSLWFRDVFPDGNWHRSITLMLLNVVERHPFFKVSQLYQITKVSKVVPSCFTTRHPTVGSSHLKTALERLKYKPYSLIRCDICVNSQTHHCNQVSEQASQSPKLPCFFVMTVPSCAPCSPITRHLFICLLSQ